MIKSKSLLLCLPLIVLSSFSQANSCEIAVNATPKQAKSYLRCLDDQITSLHRTQTMWINKLKLDLNKLEQETGNTQLRPIFERSLTRQTQFLEDSCRWRYLHKMPNATKAAIAYKQCEITILEQHLAILKQPI